MSTRSRKYQFTVHEVREGHIFMALKDAPNESARIKHLLSLGIEAEKQSLKFYENKLAGLSEHERRALLEGKWEGDVLADPASGPDQTGITKVSQDADGTLKYEPLDDVPPPFVPPKGFSAMPKAEQNKIREEYRQQVAEWHAARDQKGT